MTGCDVLLVGAPLRPSRNRTFVIVWPTRTLRTALLDWQITPYTSRMDHHDGVRQEIDAFLEQQRTTCLWSIARDWVPANDDDRRRMLELVQRTGSLAAFQRAAAMKRCL